MDLKVIFEIIIRISPYYVYFTYIFFKYKLAVLDFTQYS